MGSERVILPKPILVCVDLEPEPPYVETSTFFFVGCCDMLLSPTKCREADISAFLTCIKGESRPYHTDTEFRAEYVTI